MHILFLSTWFPYPPDNGSKIRVYHLLQALGGRHNVTLLSFAFATAKPEASELHRFCANVQVVRRNPFERSNVTRRLRFLSPVPVVTMPHPEMARAVQSCLLKDRFDVVIASTEVMADYALSIPRPTVKILEEHNSLTRWMWERRQSQTSVVQRLRCWASWQKTRYYESHLFRKFDMCVMVSKQDRDASVQMLSGYRGRIDVVPNGVDCQHNYPGLALPMLNTLVYNGALSYGANYDAMRYFLAKIYPLIRRQASDVSLIITGSTSGVDLAGLRLDESVRLSGYVDDVRPLVGGATVCIAPIRDGGGTRLKILEAMALGTPVVSTTKGAEGLDVVDGEHILLADDAVAFTERVLQLLGDSALRQRLAINARRLVEQRYDWAHIGRQFAQLVEEAADRRSRYRRDD